MRALRGSRCGGTAGPVPREHGKGGTALGPFQEEAIAWSGKAEDSFLFGDRQLMEILIEEGILEESSASRSGQECCPSDSFEGAFSGYSGP